VKVELSAEAHSQVERIDGWWRENRLAAPDHVRLPHARAAAGEREV
jgi:hypothetical protein